MKPTHQYSKAPITEAVIDIQTQAPSETKPDIFDALAKAEVKNYPLKSGILQGSIQLQVGPGAQGSLSSQKFLGVRISGPDQKQLIQLRVNGFTFSRLHPYQGWHNFQPEAQRLWNLYRESIKPERINRVAVRFINRLDLPIDTNNLDNYVTMLPKVASGLGDRIEGFFMQLKLPQPELKAMLVLTEAKAEGPADKLSILLDIDIFRDTEIPQEEDKIWQLLEEFHVRKNGIFESSITAATRRLIDD
jgi:uncharacterized protein (TIGR04255 family)